MKSSAYISEFEQFMDSYLQQHPEVLQDQQRGWRIWWERPVAPREVAEQAAVVPRSAYYYD